MSGHTMRCPVCECLFFPKRSDAIYCGARCRKRAQRTKTNRVQDEKQGTYRQTLRGIYSLQGLEAQNQLRTLALSIIQGLPDDQREKLYEAIREDVYRLKRDSIGHS